MAKLLQMKESVMNEEYSNLKIFPSYGAVAQVTSDNDDPMDPKLHPSATRLSDLESSACEGNNCFYCYILYRIVDTWYALWQDNKSMTPSWLINI